MEKNILLTIEYDGTNFNGWQKQPEKRTVQSELERALSTACGTEIKLDGTSRTDAGVHALGQCASFKTKMQIPVEKLAIVTNNILSGGKHISGTVSDVRIINAEEKPPDFHARFDAKGKKYIYKISNSSEKDIFKRNYCYQIADELDVNAMRAAAKHIVGTQDFKCFQAAGGEEKKTTIRTIHELKVIKQLKQRSDSTFEENSTFESSEINIEITGDGFLYNMVRIITGTLVEAGLGKLNPQVVPIIIESGDSQHAGHTAPAQGLYLIQVYF
jgi:tRNA pseudouridine38-40 synthase